MSILSLMPWQCASSWHTCCCSHACVQAHPRSNPGAVAMRQGGLQPGVWVQLVSLQQRFPSTAHLRLAWAGGLALGLLPESPQLLPRMAAVQEQLALIFFGLMLYLSSVPEEPAAGRSLVRVRPFCFPPCLTQLAPLAVGRGEPCSWGSRWRVQIVAPVHRTGRSRKHCVAGPASRLKGRAVASGARCAVVPGLERGTSLPLVRSSVASEQHVKQILARALRI